MKMLKKMLIAGCLGVPLMLAGCGDDDNKALTVSKSTPVAADVNTTTGVATTTAAVAATPANSSVVAFALPAGSDITPPAGTKFTAAPTIVVSTPVNGTTSGVPTVTINGTVFRLSESKGAVDISISGVSSFTVSAPGATVKIPVVVTTGLTDGDTAVPVTAVKSNGTTQSYLGTYDATAKTVTVNNVTNFCFFVIDGVWLSTTGSPGTAT